MEKAIEFDQSQLFRKVYTEEFGVPGGEPFGVLLGDYQVRHRPGPEHRINDVDVLSGIARVAAAAFAPFICGAHPSLLGLDDFRQLRGSTRYSDIFRQLEYLAWNSFRDSPDARFVGLTLPRVLMREPYEDDSSRVDGFCFKESCNGADSEGALWGSAAYAFGAVLMRAFAQSGWFADIRGVREDLVGGGIVRGFPTPSFSTDSRGVTFKSPVDVQVTDELDRDLANLGFIPLCPCQDTELCAFFSTPSVQRPKDYDTALANVNARLSAMLNYMLCVSRFGQYLKVIGRDKIGAFRTPAECEAYLSRWLLNYVATSDEASFEQKARFPLRKASVEVREQPGKPGSYRCVMHLRPHFQLEQVVSTVKLVTELGVGGTA
jgi:type VI secretion system protein ImpD